MMSTGRIDSLKLPLMQIRNMFTNTIKNLIYVDVSTESLEVVVPKNVFLRTQLLCGYVEDVTGQSFDENTLLTLLYDDFLNNSIERYDLSAVRQEIDQTKYDEKLLIHSNDTIYEYGKRRGARMVVTISFDKNQVEKGELLLDELVEIYGKSPTLEMMVSAIWINFIEDYKINGGQQTLRKIKALLINSLSKNDIE